MSCCYERALGRRCRTEYYKTGQRIRSSWQSAIVSEPWFWLQIRAHFSKLLCEYWPPIYERLYPQRSGRSSISPSNNRYHRDSIWVWTIELSYVWCWRSALRTQKMGSLFRRRPLPHVCGRPERVRPMSCRRQNGSKYSSCPSRRWIGAITI